jgi:hypothetical protein
MKCGASKYRHCERSAGSQSAVIANEVKQSSKTKMHFSKPSGLPRRLCLLMKLLANRLSQQAGKSLVIAMTGHSGFQLSPE